jgi:hypothetical protein
LIDLDKNGWRSCWPPTWGHSTYQDQNYHLRILYEDGSEFKVVPGRGLFPAGAHRSNGQFPSPEEYKTA